MFWKGILNRIMIIWISMLTNYNLVHFRLQFDMKLDSTLYWNTHSLRTPCIIYRNRATNSRSWLEAAKINVKKYFLNTLDFVCLPIWCVCDFHYFFSNFMVQETAIFITTQKFLNKWYLNDCLKLLLIWLISTRLNSLFTITPAR